MKSTSNSNNNDINNTYKPIYIRVKPEEYNYISQQAKSMNLSINTYGKKRLLDSTKGCGTQLDRIVQLIPGIYAKIDQIKDIAIRNELKREVGQICQLLK